MRLNPENVIPEIQPAAALVLGPCRPGPPTRRPHPRPTISEFAPTGPQCSGMERSKSPQFAHIFHSPSSSFSSSSFSLFLIRLRREPRCASEVHFPLRIFPLRTVPAIPTGLCRSADGPHPQRVARLVNMDKPHALLSGEVLRVGTTRGPAQGCPGCGTTLG